MSMRVVVVGAGEVGYHVAERLSNEGHEVVVVDTEAQRLDYVESHLDVAVVEGTGASPAVLERAGVAKASLLVAVTSVDEVNLVCCMVVRGRRDMVKIARISNPDFYAGVGRLRPERFDVDVMINPERELAIDTLRLLQSSVATDIAVLSDTELQVISIPVTEEAPIVGRTLAAIDHDMGDRSMLTAAIQRDGTTLIPTGSTRIEGGDQVYVVTKPDEVSVALALCGHKVQTLKHVMVAGGSREAHYLTQFLINYGVSTTVLVADRERAKDLAERLPKALVLNGDATDVELLELEGVGSVDAFVAVTEEDQTNILSSLVAKHAGAKQVVTLVNKIDYVSLARRIGLDAAVSPRLSAANAIMGHVQRGSVTRVSIFKDTDAEAISFAVSGESPVVGRPLADIEFPKGSIVAAIERNGHVIVPRGSDVLQAGDIAIVFTLPEARGPVKRLFPS